MFRFLVAFSLLAPLNAQLLVNTFAGGQIPPGAVGSAVSGLTWDSAGNLVFRDSEYNVIRRLRPDGTIDTLAGGAIPGFSGDGGPATDALIDLPLLPAYDASGNLCFLDAANYRIRRIDTNGVITTIAGNGQFFVSGQNTEGPATTLSLPEVPLFGMGVDGLGNVYLADSTNGLIRRVTPAGNLQVLAKVNSPQLIAVDPTGNVYVSQSPNLLRISPNGAIANFVTLPFLPNEPGTPSVSGLATDPKRECLCLRRVQWFAFLLPQRDQHYHRSPKWLHRNDGDRRSKKYRFRCLRTEHRHSGAYGPIHVENPLRR